MTQLPVKFGRFFKVCVWDCAVEAKSIAETEGHPQLNTRGR